MGKTTEKFEQLTLGSCGKERAAPSYALYIHFSNASSNCNRRPQRCRSHHQSHLSEGAYSSLDEDEATAGFVVDEGVDERLVCSETKASAFLLVELTGHAKSRNVSKIRLMSTIYLINKVRTFQC